MDQRDMSPRVAAVNQIVALCSLNMVLQRQSARTGHRDLLKRMIDSNQITTTSTTTRGHGASIQSLFGHGFSVYRPR
jgi:hypothetical protein